jgi:hypothetical protein
MEVVPFCNTTAIQVSDHVLCKALFGHVKRIWNIGEHSEYFPGPQPISIERKHIDILRNNKYWVCEKSDGLRFLFVCIIHQDKPYCFMINRKKDIYMINIELVSNVFNGTVLDGELIQNKDTGGYEFVVYDATMVMGETVMMLPHSIRMERVQSLVENIKYKPNLTPVIIKSKKFCTFETFENYVKNVVPSIDHNMDGYVFTPEDEPVKSGTHNTMFKWKELHKNTVDFLVEKHFHIPGQYILKVSRGCTIKSLFGVNLHVPVGSEIEYELQQSKIPLVVECRYISQNLWSALFTRKDKTNPNSFFTWTKTQFNIEENIKLNEFFT